MNYDVAIFGAGPGGYVAAMRSAQLGLKTVLIEKEFVGGTCLNVGCIPTKSFAAVAERFAELKYFDEFGIEGANAANALVNMAKVVERKNKIVAGLRSGIQGLLKARKIDYVQGTAKLLPNKEIAVSGANAQNLTAENIIIATGSTWRPLPNLVPDGKFILTSDHMLDLAELPKKLLIVGGGVIGCEFASIMNAFGVDVTIVEFAEQILPMEDAAVARSLTAIFKKRGVKLLTKTSVQSVSKGKATLSTGEEIEADKILVSVGRKPFTDGTGIDALGVGTKNGFILTDEYMKTNVPGLYAIGDVALPSNGAPKPMLAHVASHEGLLAVANIKAEKEGRQLTKMDYSVVPRPIFTSPEIGCVGLTEKQIKESGMQYKAGRFAYGALSKAICDGSTEGLVQVYVGEGDKMLGAVCFGSHATDICSEITVAMKNGLTAAQVFETIHAHPTYSEAVMETLEDAHGMAIHKLSR